MGATLSTSGEGKKTLRHADMTQLERSRLAIKAGFGLLFVANIAVIAHALLTDPKSALSPHHHSNLRRQRLAKRSEESTTPPDDAQALRPRAQVKE